MSNPHRNHTRAIPRKRRTLERSTAVCALLALPGCVTNKAGAACDTPPPFFAKFDAAEDVNTDDKGRALPTVVWFLQLKDSVKLELAGFQKLSAAPKDFLGEDLLLSSELTVTPGHQKGIWLQRDPKAKFVAAVVNFRQPLGYSWLAVAKLPPVPADQCVDQPAGEHEAPPTPEDTLRFKLQGYQIDYLRPSKGRK